MRVCSAITPTLPDEILSSQLNILLNNQFKLLGFFLFVLSVIFKHYLLISKHILFSVLFTLKLSVYLTPSVCR